MTPSQARGATVMGRADAIAKTDSGFHNFWRVNVLLPVWKHLGDTRYFAWAPNDGEWVHDRWVIVGEGNCRTPR